MNLRIIGWGGVVSVLCAVWVSVSASPDKIDPLLRAKIKQSGPASALVILKEQADLSAADTETDRDAKGRLVYDALRTTALSTQSELIELLSEKQVRFQQFYIVNMIAIENVSASLIEELAQRPDVEKVVSNFELEREFPSPGTSEPWNDSVGIGANIAATGADRVWDEFGVRGEGIVIAGQDTGYQWDHPALRASYRGSQGDTLRHDYSWHDAIRRPETGPGRNKCGYQTEAPCDDNAHGTHTMGTMVGDDGLGNQIGMAPKSQWIGCRNMDAGAGKPSTYIECFEFFLAPYPHGGDKFTEGDPTKAPHVINNSWGCPTSEGCQGDEIQPVLAALKSAGVFVVVSAGNSGPGCSTIEDPPAWHSLETFAVGAYSHTNGAIAGFSSRGPSKRDGGLGPDLTAPGVNVRSAVPGSKYSGFGWSGTSMAGPHVAGAVALLWSARPELIGKIDQTSEILRSAATPSVARESCGDVPGTAHPNNTWGYGKLDIYKAIQAL